MASTYDYLGTVTAAGNSTALTLSNIPQTYTDIEIIFQLTAAINYSARGEMQFNGVTSAVYDWSRLGNLQTTSGAENLYGATYIESQYGVGMTSGSDSLSCGFTRTLIPGYTTAKNHTARQWSWGMKSGNTCFIGNTFAYQRNSAAITSVTMTSSNQNITAGCTGIAYGINYS